MQPDHRPRDRALGQSRSGRALRLLFAAAEIHPLAKTGGLADVAAALPRALAAQGVEVRLIMPAYPSALDAAVSPRRVADFELEPALPSGELLLGRTPDTGLPVYLVRCPALFARDGSPYQDEGRQDWPDNAVRFAYLSRVAARLALGGLDSDWGADIAHANDWHTALLPALLATQAASGETPRPGTVLTVHNLAFQGVFPATVFPRLGLPEGAFAVDGVEFHGQVSFLKGGIRYADRIATVSPTYAREILTPEEGCGLEGLLQSRAQHLVGILNGVDTQVWHPAHDPFLPLPYDADDFTGKRVCKATAQAEMGLTANPEAPLLVSVSRLTDQKMADCLPQALRALAEEEVQIAVLGDGEPALERSLLALAAEFPGRIAVRIGYREPLAHCLFAAGDIMLAPARFEPCGLTALYAMLYGTVPVVRPVGGLADSVVAANETTLRDGTATGFAFGPSSAEGLLAGCRAALAVFAKEAAWRRLQRAAMRRPCGWDGPAARYLELYLGTRSPDDGGGQAAADRSSGIACIA